MLTASQLDSSRFHNATCFDAEEERTKREEQRQKIIEMQKPRPSNQSASFLGMIARPIPQLRAIKPEIKKRMRHQFHELIQKWVFEAAGFDINTDPIKYTKTSAAENPELFTARNVCMYLVKKNTRINDTNIASMFAPITRSTVTQILNKIKKKPTKNQTKLTAQIQPIIDAYKQTHNLNPTKDRYQAPPKVTNTKLTISVEQMKELILNTSIDVCGITREEMCSVDRHQRIAICRHIVTFLLRWFTNIKLEVIGKIIRFGDETRHHSTQINSCKIVANLLQSSDEEMTTKLSKILDRLCTENNLELNLENPPDWYTRLLIKHIN